jgi:glycerophosphoryl diester phosphodiesterase
MAVPVTRTGRQLLAASVVTALLVSALVALPWVPIYLGTAAPTQFYRELPAPLDPGARRVLGIGHNAGNHPATTATALEHRADVIEIDVVRVDGELAAGRDRPWQWLADRVFQGQTLDEAWREAARARIVQLDLQQTARPLLEALIDFLRRVPGDRPVMVSTRDADAVQYLAPRLPSAATPVLSVPYPEAVTRIQEDRQLAGAVQGISVYRELVDETLVGWAHARGMVVLAWPVDDPAELDEALRDGVDGVSTANLAVLEAVSG